jgi:hypothetical protein
MAEERIEVARRVEGFEGPFLFICYSFVASRKGVRERRPGTRSPPVPKTRATS